MSAFIYADSGTIVAQPVAADNHHIAYMRFYYDLGVSSDSSLSMSLMLDSGPTDLELRPSRQRRPLHQSRGTDTVSGARVDAVLDSVERHAC